MIRTLLVACVVAVGCARAPSASAQAAPAPATPARATPAQTRPALVLVLTIDQLRPDYLTRWQSQFTGGLARLLAEGAVFSEAYQDHAITETAPGHASVLSGRFPYSTGIAANMAGVNTNDSPLLNTDGVGASPFRFQGGTLVDWMVAAHPDTRVLSVSRKDRGAILPIGRGKYPVYWYAPASGIFTTSAWYGDILPEWVMAFNSESRVTTRYAGTNWELLGPDSLYAEPDSVPAESFGQGFVFPHAVPSEPMTATNLLIAYPFMDELTIDFALRGVAALELGTRGGTDLLAVSLSTTDAVGHRWGPDSREMHDQVLRLDRSLGRLLDSLTAIVGEGKLAVVLTADHAVAPSPEVRSTQFDNRRARRVDLDAFQPAITAAAIEGSQASLPLEALGFDGFTLTVDRTMIPDRDREIRKVGEAFVKAARKVPGVMRVDMVEQLAKADTTRDTIARRWLHMFRPGGDVIAVVTLEPFNIFGNAIVATHGSPHDYDAHVPLLFWGAPWFRTMREERFVRVVDIGPTLAALLGVPVTEPVDGRVLTDALRNTP